MPAAAKLISILTALIGFLAFAATPPNQPAKGPAQQAKGVAQAKAKAPATVAKAPAGKAAAKAPAVNKAAASKAPVVAKGPAGKAPAAARSSAAASAAARPQVNSRAVYSRTPARYTRVPTTAAARRNAPAVTRQPAYFAPITPSQDRYKEIQQALADKGYYKGEVTGAWSSESIEALKNFQRSQNLEADGKLGSLSLIALGLGPKRLTAQTLPTPALPQQQPQTTPTPQQPPPQPQR